MQSLTYFILQYNKGENDFEKRWQMMLISLNFLCHSKVFVFMCCLT